MKLNLIYSTGQAAAMLGLTEPQLNNHIRRGHLTRIAPGPGGRRLWTEDDIAAARSALADRELARRGSGSAEAPDAR